MSSSDESEVICDLVRECETLLEKGVQGAEGELEWTRIWFIEYQELPTIPVPTLGPIPTPKS